MDNHNIVSGSSDSTVKIWSLETGECLYTLCGHNNYVYGVAALPCNEIVSVSSDETLKIWN